MSPNLSTFKHTPIHNTTHKHIRTNKINIYKYLYNHTSINTNACDTNHIQSLLRPIRDVFLRLNSQTLSIVIIRYVLVFPCYISRFVLDIFFFELIRRTKNVKRILFIKLNILLVLRERERKKDSKMNNRNKNHCYVCDQAFVARVMKRLIMFNNQQKIQLCIIYRENLNKPPTETTILVFALTMITF